MVAKYLILSSIIIFVVLLIMIIVKPKWFFGNKGENGIKAKLDFKRTSINGDMTLNSLAATDTVTTYLNRGLKPPRIERTRHRRRGNNEMVNNEMVNNEMINNEMVNNKMVNNEMINNEMINNEMINNEIANNEIITTLTNRDINNPRLNQFVDMVFNDIFTVFQHMHQGNELNYIRHMNENNIQPIILNDNAILMEIIDNQLLEMVGAHRDNIIQNRQNAARGSNETNLGAVNNYLDLSIGVTSDAQNVHDHTVLAGFKMILEKLKKSLIPELETLEEIENEIKKGARRYSNNRPQLTLKALAVIEKMKEGEKITALEIDGEPTTDAMCLQYVWNRTKHPNNQENCEKIKQSIFDNLIDSWEADIIMGEKIVCVTGRATRMLGSLTLLDFDEENWEVKKFEDFKNEIFNKVKHIIQIESEKAANDPNGDIRNAGRMYLATTMEEFNTIEKPSQGATNELNTRIKEAISNMIDEYVIEIEKQFHTNIPSYMKNSVKREAIASIDMF
jgi:hypothetical protein